MNYPTLITKDTVVLVKGSRRLIANKTHLNFNKIIDAIKNKRWNNIERLFKVAESMEKCFDVTIKNGSQVFYKGRPCHSIIAQKVLEFLKENLPHRPMMKFLNNIMSNPDNNSRESLYDYLTQQQLPITEDGCFIAVKAINADWTDIHTGKICNKIGSDVYMDRAKVNKGRDECAGAGLHVGSAKYVGQYSSKQEFTRYIMVKVNPRDVVCVPREGFYEKIRLCRYKVIKEISKEDLNFTSVYAPQNEQYKSLRHNKRDKNGKFCRV